MLFGSQTVPAGTVPIMNATKLPADCTIVYALMSFTTKLSIVFSTASVTRDTEPDTSVTDAMYVYAPGTRPVRVAVVSVGPPWATSCHISVLAMSGAVTSA